MNKKKIIQLLVLVIFLAGGGVYLATHKNLIKNLAETVSNPDSCTVPLVTDLEGVIPAVADDPVNYSHWAYKYISAVLQTPASGEQKTAIMNHYQVQNGIDSDGKPIINYNFYPGKKMLRADIAILAARVYAFKNGGSPLGLCNPNDPNTKPFVDVLATDDNCNYIAFAKQKGLLSSWNTSSNCPNTSNFCPYTFPSGAKAYSSAKDLSIVLQKIGFGSSLAPETPSNMQSLLTTQTPFTRDFAAMLVANNVPGIMANGNPQTASILLRWRMPRGKEPDLGFHVQRRKTAPVAGNWEWLTLKLAPERFDQGSDYVSYIDGTPEANATYQYAVYTQNRNWETCNWYKYWQQSYPALPATLAAASVPKNLIANSSFEAGSGTTIATSWTLIPQQTRATAIAKSGSYSLYFAGSNVNAAASSAPISVIPNTKYTLSGWVYRRAGYTGNAFLDVADIPEECNALSSTNDAWQRVSCSFTTGATRTSVNVRIVHNLNATGYAYWDAIQLQAGALTDYIAN